MARQDKDGAWSGDKRTYWTTSDGDEQPGTQDSFTWDDQDALRMRHLCAIAGKVGHAVSFAQNRQNNGGSVTILDGPYRPRWRCYDVQSTTELLDRLIARYEESAPPSRD